jgi:hypothetical protein
MPGQPPLAVLELDLSAELAAKIPVTMTLSKIAGQSQQGRYVKVADGTQR